MDADAEAVAALEEAPTTGRLLAVLAESLAHVLAADACLISRAIGDMLVDLVEHSRDRRLPGGHGYLISDFPATQRVLKERRGTTVFVGDAGADVHEVELLKKLGFDSLLMVPIVVRDGTWGLAEVYRAEPFAAAEVERVTPLVVRAAELMSELEP